jgi:hypothetical protein
VAHRELERFTVGERIRIDGEEGRIVEIHRTGIDIATSEGIASIPAARFASKSVLRLGDKQEDS